jgi:hypothetical protein
MKCTLNVPKRLGKYACCPKLVTPHTTCCASCPKPKSETKDNRYEKKNSKRKKVRKSNVCISFSPQVVQVFVAQPKTLCMFLLLFFAPNLPPYKSTLSLFPKQTNNPKPCKNKCCIIKI